MIKKEGKDYVVKTKGVGGKVHGRHKTQAEAAAQMRALYANVPEARK